MKKYLPLLFLLFPFFGSACSCAGPETFCKTVNFENPDEHVNSILVIRGRKAKTESDGMRVDIQDVLFGNVQGNSLFVRDGNGANCWQFTGGLDEGDEFLAVLNATDNDFRIFICGITFLPIENGIIKGPIKENINSLPYEELAGLIDCGNLKSTRLENMLKVYPTLTQGAVQLEYTSNEDDLQLSYTIYDALGRQMESSNSFVLSPSSSEFIEMGHLRTGMYIVELVGNRQKVVYRIVVT